MGLLSEGTALSWEETKKYTDHVRHHGIKQFINQHCKLKNRKDDTLYWGDEIEYMLVKFDDNNRTVRLSLGAERVLEKLQNKAKDKQNNVHGCWRPEYGAYVVESSPVKPYGGLFAHLNTVETSMRLRREELQSCLEPNEVAVTLTIFPRTGCGQFTEPKASPTPTIGASHSLFYPDEAVYQGHPRFITLTRNIRERREEKVDINIPVFKDKYTKVPFMDEYPVLEEDEEGPAGAKPDHIYMDCMGFGMGCCCLQTTFQACNLTEAKVLYDQLAPLCPIMLALSAGSPIYRGFLSDTDTRWNVLAQAVDDRTPEERGIKPLRTSKFKIPTSRYDPIASYLSPENQAYNDSDLVLDEETCAELRKAGVDAPLSRHIAHLFIRDTISLFNEKIYLNDEEETDHFENIQSTNWQSLRFKLPPPNSDIGWRVEFRPMDVQLSDFENAAYCAFIAILTRVILTLNLNLVIPMSKVHENILTANNRDAVINDKFYFRSDIFTEDYLENNQESLSGEECSQQRNMGDQYKLYTINEIINGCEHFVGLIPLIYKYMDTMETDVDTSCTMTNYLSFISRKASGKIKTTARWIRDFVQNHPDYKQDSVVSETINYDLLKVCVELSKENNTSLIQPQVSSNTSSNVLEATD